MSISRRGGGIGRRAGLKIRFRKECRFEPDRPHQSFRFFSGEQPAAALGPASICAMASASRMCRFR